MTEKEFNKKIKEYKYNDNQEVTPAMRLWFMDTYGWCADDSEVLLQYNTNIILDQGENDDKTND